MVLMNQLAGQEQGTDLENRLMNTVGEEEDNGVN